MSAPVLLMAVRLKARSTVLAGIGMILVILMVGALFPAVGGSIGKLDLPRGVGELLGGADYGSLTGWMRSEIGAVYGPLVIGALAIAAAGGSIAGEEQARVLGLVLAHPVSRTRMMTAKAGAVAASVIAVALSTWAGLTLGVLAGGGGISFGNQAALSLHLCFFGLAIGALALAIAAATGSRTTTAAGAAAFGILSFLINGFAPLIHGITWLRYASLFHYYSGDDPLTRGVDLADLLALAGFALAGLVVALAAFRRRDLRA